MKPLAYHTDVPRDLAQATLWREALIRDISVSQREYAAVRAAYQAGAESLKSERNRRWSAHQELVARLRYLKQCVHLLSHGYTVDGVKQSNEEAEAARAAWYAEVDERNRQRRIVAHREGTTNPYLLLGAVKELFEKALQEVLAVAGREARDTVLSVDEAVMLANVRDVLKSPEARESIERYVATKVVEDVHPRLS